MAHWRGFRRAKPLAFRPVAYAELAQLSHRLNMLTGGHMIAEYEQGQETVAAVAGFSGKLALDTERI